MDIEKEKLNLIEWISKLEDSSVVYKIKQIKEGGVVSENWWNELQKEEIDSIKRGLTDFEEGKTHSHEMARKIYEKHL